MRRAQPIPSSPAAMQRAHAEALRRMTEQIAHASLAGSAQSNTLSWEDKARTPTKLATDDNGDIKAIYGLSTY